MRAYDLTVTGSFAISGSDKITFTDAGKLGIGTSNPGAELEIKGIARDTELFVIERFNDTQNFLEFKDVSNDPSLEIFKGDGQTFFKINETGDIFSNIANAKISGSATSTGSFGQLRSGPQIITNNLANNVGLIVDTNAETNAIQTDAKWGPEFSQTTSDGTGLTVVRNNNDTETYPLVRFTSEHATTTQPTLTIKQDGAGYGLEIDQNGDKAAIYIDTEATTQQGILFNAPAQTSGDIIRIGDANSLTSGRMLFLESNSSDSNSRELIRIINDHASATGTTPIYIQNDSTGGGIEFRGTGHAISGSATSTGSFGMLGVSRANPTAPLHIYQDNANTAVAPTAGILIEQDGTGDAVLQFLLTGVKRWNMGIDNSDSDKFKITHGVSDLNDADIFAIDTSGKVGIGTSSPDTNLHIHKASAGSVAAYSEAVLAVENSGNTAINLLSGNGNHGQIAFGDDGDNDKGIVGYDHGADRFYVTVNGSSTKYLVVDSTGNVGVGTSSPARALHVVGDALVTGILTAQEFHTEFVSASVMFDSGSTKFGDDTVDIHQMTGSLKVSGSLGINLPLSASGAETSLDVGTLVEGGDGVNYGVVIRGHELPGTNLELADGIGLKFEIPIDTATSNIGASIETIKASNLDSNSETQMIFKTSGNDETLDTALTIAQNQNVFIEAAKSLYFDGGGHTYISETSNDVLDVYVGGANALKIAPTEIQVPRYITHMGDGNNYLDFGTDTLTIVNDGGDTLQLLSNHDVIVKQGNLGIGTSSPAYHLHISASSGANAIQFIESNTADKFSYLGFKVSGTDYNVGVGGSTTIFPNKFYIYDNSAAELRATISSTTLELPTANYLISGSATSTGSFGMVHAGIPSAGLQLGSTSNGHALIQSRTIADYIQYNANGGHFFTTNGANYNYINSDNNFYNASNIIQTTANGVISGSSTSTGSFGSIVTNTRDIYRYGVQAISDDAEDNPAVDGRGGGILIENLNSAGSAMLRMRGGDGAARIMYGENNSTDKLLFSPRNAATNFVTFDQDGKVGIGTTSPDTTLHIQTSDASLGTADANASLIVEENDHTYIELLTPNDKQSGIIFSDGAIGGLINYNHSDNSIIFQTAAATFLTANSSQNVGIGVTPEVTNALMTSLQIGGNTNISTLKAQGASGEVDFGHNFYFAANGEDKYISTDEATQFRQGGGAFRFRTAPSGTADNAITFTERMTILQAGNVGIGTTTPSSQLNVVRSGTVSDNDTVVLADISFTKTGGDADQSTLITGLKSSAIHNDANSGFGNLTGGEFNATNTQNKNAAGNGDNIMGISANTSHVAGIVNTVTGVNNYINVDAGGVDQYVAGSNITVDVESAVNITGDVYGQKIYMDVDDTNAAQVWGLEIEDGGSGNWDGGINTSLSDGYAISGSSNSTGSFGQLRSGPQIITNNLANNSALTIDNNTEGYAIVSNAKWGPNFTQDSADGRGLEVSRNNNDTESHPLVSFTSNHTAATQPTLKIQQDGASQGILIEQNGAASALKIDQNANDYALEIVTDATSGQGINVNASSLQASGMAARFYSNSSNSGTRKLIDITNDHASATGTTLLNLQQDSTGDGIHYTGGGHAISGSSTSTGSFGQVEASNIVEGLPTGGTQIMRSIRLNISPGDSPGTNITVDHDVTAGRSFNTPSLTDGANITNNTSNGSFALNNGSTRINVDLGNAIGVLSECVLVHDLNGSSTSAGEIYFSNSTVSSNDLSIALFKSGNQSLVDWRTVLAAGDSITIQIAYMSSS